MKISKKLKEADSLDQLSLNTRKGLKGFVYRFAKNFKRDWQLHLMLLFPVVYMFIFHYIPIYGVQIAFRDYKAADGIVGSEWVGMKWFIKFFNNYKFKQIFFNTIRLSLYSIFATFPLPVIFALLINLYRSSKFRKVIQTVTYFPHFLSVVTVVAIITMVFGAFNGLYGNLYRMFGNTGYPPDFANTANAFPHLYVWSGLWQSLGWNTIIYTAALTAVPQELHEAAQLDGASRFKRMIHVDLPMIMPTVAIMLILRFGSIMGIGFAKVYLMQNPMNVATSEVISTYVYKYTLGGGGESFSYGAAVDLFNSLINCVMLLLVNFISNKMSHKEVGLF
ncbi:MAG: sugar ABC transporter permease [Lachnospiraceae bacterium]|nr:sugar ABC transporter permease [Lachnospiraceae bacterium]